MIRPKGHNILCAVSDCDRKAATKLYCTMHYKRVWRNGTLDCLINKYKVGDVCEYCKVERPVASNLCNACGVRLSKKGYVERDNAKAGEGSINAGGYHVDTVDGQRVYSHRVAAEYYLGRALQPGEVVHHKDGDRLNNTKENLEVLPSQSVHMKLHMQKGAE